MEDAVTPIDRLREIALGFPEAVEKETWGHPTFRVRDKIFVGCSPVDGEDDSEPGRYVCSMKAAPGEQESLLAHGHPFYRPDYVGNRGWIGIVLDDTLGWDEIGELIEDSYRTIAPKKLSKLLDSVGRAGEEA